MCWGERSGVQTSDAAFYTNYRRFVEEWATLADMLECIIVTMTKKSFLYKWKDALFSPVVSKLCFGYLHLLEETSCCRVCSVVLIAILHSKQNRSWCYFTSSFLLPFRATGILAWNRNKMYVCVSVCAYMCIYIYLICLIVCIYLIVLLKHPKNESEYKNVTKQFKNSPFCVLNHFSRLCGRGRLHSDWHLPGCQSFMTTLTTVAQGTAVVVQPYLFEPSESDSDQNTAGLRASENSSVRPVTDCWVAEYPVIHISPAWNCECNRQQLHVCWLAGLVLQLSGPCSCLRFQKLWSCNVHGISVKVTDVHPVQLFTGLCDAKWQLCSISPYHLIFCSSYFELWTDFNITTLAGPGL